MAAVAGASGAWRDTPVKERARRLGRLRHALADDPSRFTDALRSDTRDDATTLSAEVLPLADAARWIADEAPRVLRAERLGMRGREGGRPRWLLGVAAEVRREPVGLVLIIGPGNFPLFLPGVHALHALAAGNTVWVKPSPDHGCAAVMHKLRRVLVDTCGVPADALTVLDPSPDTLAERWDHVDLVVLTGSEATGLAVRRECAERGVPCIMELSGCDAAVVLDDADLGVAARCVRFGMMLNGSRTCIAPRRAVVVDTLAERFVARLVEELDTQPAAAVDERLRQRVNRLIGEAVEAGATIRCGAMPDGGVMRPTVLTGVTPEMAIADADLFAPVLSVIVVPDADAAVEAVNASGFGLGGSIFGPESVATRVAARLDVGSVVINDVIVPTADPRLPFEGRHRSGFGPTRGAAGLLAMTRTKAVSVRRRAVYPHLDPVDARTAPLLRGLLAALHRKGPRRRVRGVLALLKSIRGG